MASRIRHDHMDTSAVQMESREPSQILIGVESSIWLPGAFTVADLYYSHPILNILAEEFGVPYVRVSNIPTLSQAGYAVGLLFLCPLGDIFRRRAFVLSLVFITATFWYAKYQG